LQYGSPKRMTKKKVKKPAHKRFWSWFKHHPIAVPTITLSVLLAATMIGLLTFGKKTLQPAGSHIVYVTIEGKQQILPTTAETVEEFLQRLNVVINEGDVVEPQLETAIVEDGFRINLYRARPVIVQDGGDKVVVSSAALSPRMVAAQAGITVYPEDIVEKAPIESFTRDGFVGEKIVLGRAEPVSFNLYGTQATVRTHSKSVGDLLKEKNITLTEGDSVQPALETPIAADTQIFVVRSGTQLATVEETIEFTTETIEDPSLSFGTIVNRQKGSAGKKLVTYQVNTVNGKEVGRTKIQEVTIQAPVRQVTARGKAIYIPEDKSGWMAAAGIPASDFPYVYYIINRENGLWCPTRWQGQRNCPAYYQELYPGAESVRTLGYGMCQSTPAIKMADAGADWRTNPVTQLKWCTGYATSRYGGWQGAYEAWSRREQAGHGWW
jgi:resuscitation-promoting factor RpfB